MSDTVHKWARRELEAITLNDHPLNTAHLSALAVVAAIMADESVQERVPLFEIVVAEERDILHRVRELHQPFYNDHDGHVSADTYPTCMADHAPWPCATIVALDGRAGHEVGL